MKARLLGSMAIGAAVSLLVLLLAAAFPHSRWQDLAIPAHIAMILIWGPHGPVEISDALLDMFGLLINALVYGLIAFGVLALLRKRHQEVSDPSQGDVSKP
jgi:hypothetical protein